MKVNDEKVTVTVKKVFVSLQEGPYNYRKKRTYGDRDLNEKLRIQFVCTLCEGQGGYTVCFAIVTVGESEEEDVYELEEDSYPHPSDHDCIPTGVEHAVVRFNQQLRAAVRQDPCRAMPSLYGALR